MENRDVILTMFINTVNNTDISMGITLNIGGQIITGNLISYKRYLREVGEQFGNTNDEHGIGIALKDSFKSVADEVEKIFANTENTEDDGNKPQEPNFIHLSEVRIIGQTNVTSKHWRGKLSSVDGFIFGRMEEN